MKLEHQKKNIATTYMHRLAVKGTPIESEQRSAPWVGYTDPAPHYTTKGTFFAVTEYHQGSVEFPDARKIYWIQEAPEDI